MMWSEFFIKPNQDLSHKSKLPNDSNFLNVNNNLFSCNQTNSKENSYGIKFWYTNANSLNPSNKVKVNLFLADILSTKSDVVMVTETWFSDDNVLIIPGYSTYNCNRCENKRGGGVCIYINSNILTSEIANDILNSTDLEQIWCKLIIGSKSIILGCIYRPPHAPVENIRLINKSITEAKRLVCCGFVDSILLMGDFNFPGLEWDEFGQCMSYNDDICTNEFIDTINDCFLVQLVSKPTFQMDRLSKVNILDLLLTDSYERIDKIKHHATLGDMVRGLE